MNKGSGQSLKHGASSTAALIPMEYADLTTAKGERVELGRELIHYIPVELEEKANLDFWGSAKIPCPTLTHNFSGHYEEGAHWSTKKLRNLKATSPYISCTVCSTLTIMASATSASPPTLLFGFYLISFLLYLCWSTKGNLEIILLSSAFGQTNSYRSERPSLVRWSLRKRGNSNSRIYRNSSFSLPNDASTRNCPAMQGTPSYFGDSNFLFLKTLKTL